ncbi:metallophosphoesterase family protein [Comamonas humi]
MTQQGPLWKVGGAMAATAAALALQGCGSGGSDAASNARHIEAAWVVVGAGNQATARAITSYTPVPAATPGAACPQISINGQTSRMGLRAGPATAPLRPTASAPEDSKPAEFPVSVCETALPADATDVKVAGQSLPLPKAQPQRIVVLGDTGCRMKKADNAWQACGDAVAWPFATVADTAAGFKPDLVLHVGDYHYRENACPADVKGCQGSPWGYGWDTWQADLFKPAAKLLAAAPWVMVRGNHEECARGGQGWFRFLDTQPFGEARSCNSAANDATANYSDPYAVRLGGNTQVVVFDSAKVGRAALKPSDAQFAIYQKQFQQVADLAAKGGTANTIFTNHHPILAFAPIPGAAPAPGNLALQSAMASLYPQAYYPPGVNLALHGHVHNFQAISFKSGHAATIVSGDAGDNLDVALPDPLAADATPAPGAVIDRITHHASFGFVLMERRAAPSSGWTFQAYSAAGKLMATCQQEGLQLDCDKTGFLTP